MDGHRAAAWIILALLTGGDVYAWRTLTGERTSASPAYHQLDVGQGDAEAVRLPGGLPGQGALIMTDAGPDRTVLRSLARAMPEAHRIDLAVISHPQLDHFNGYIHLLDHYSIGAFIINGRDDGEVEEWSILIEKARSRGIPIITLAAGDSISYGPSTIRLLSPGPDWIQSGELNDTGFVEFIVTPDWTALLTADIGTNIEEILFSGTNHQEADILKVGHHGSKYSTDDLLLERTRPTLAVISAGASNRYGHPASSTLNRLDDARIPVFRTDRHGNISIRKERGLLKVSTERQDALLRPYGPSAIMQEL